MSVLDWLRYQIWYRPTDVMPWVPPNVIEVNDRPMLWEQIPLPVQRQIVEGFYQFEMMTRHWLAARAEVYRGVAVAIPVFVNLALLFIGFGLDRRPPEWWWLISWSASIAPLANAALTLRNGRARKRERRQLTERRRAAWM